MRYTLILLAICISIGTTAELTIEATGFGVSRQQAIQLAQREALARGIGQTLVSTTEVENFMVKRDLILTKTAGFVKSTEVLSASSASDGSWKVTIRAVVSDEGLADDVRSLLLLREVIGNPRIAFIIDEQGVEGDPALSRRIVETEMSRLLKERKFEVVDPNTALRLYSKGDLTAALQDDTDAAVRLGTAVNAEVIVVGSAVSRTTDLSDHPHFKNSGMKSAAATLSLRAISVGSRRVLASATETLSAVDPNPATAAQKALIQLIGNKVMSAKTSTSFFSQLVAGWSKAAKEGATYEVTLTGIDRFETVQAFVNALTPVARKTDQRSFSQKTAVLSVQYLGSVEDLCTQINGMKIGEQQTVSVEGCGGTAVRAQLK